MTQLKYAHRLALQIEGGSKPDPATKAELDHRLSQRSTPTIEPTLTPNAAQAIDVVRDVHERNERRIQNLSERLGKLRDVAERDFSLANMQGRAQHDFDRNRE